MKSEERLMMEKEGMKKRYGVDEIIDNKQAGR